jgi:hypothetical protein
LATRFSLAVVTVLLVALAAGCGDDEGPDVFFDERGPDLIQTASSASSPFTGDVVLDPSTATSTPLPAAPTVVFYDLAVLWQDTGLDLAAGDIVQVTAYGSATYDAGRSTTHYIGPEGNGGPTGWGGCPDHSLVGWIGGFEPSAATPPEELPDVLCLGDSFSDTAPASGRLYLAVNDYNGDPGVYIDNEGTWTVEIGQQ